MVGGDVDRGLGVSAVTVQAIDNIQNDGIACVCFTTSRRIPDEEVIAAVIVITGLIAEGNVVASGTVGGQCLSSQCQVEGSGTVYQGVVPPLEAVIGILPQCLGNDGIPDGRETVPLGGQYLIGDAIAAVQRNRAVQGQSGKGWAAGDGDILGE